MEHPEKCYGEQHPTYITGRRRRLVGLSNRRDRLRSWP